MSPLISCAYTLDRELLMATTMRPLSPDQLRTAMGGNLFNRRPAPPAYTQPRQASAPFDPEAQFERMDAQMDKMSDKFGA